MHKYRVSIIVPVYNGEKYIRECIDSLLNQTLDDIEIIIINDGSTDQTEIIIEEYVKNNQNVKIIKQNNHGLYYTRKDGLEAAQGKYVSWVDADDFIDRQMIEKLYNAAENNDSDLAYCDYDWYPNNISTKAKWFRLYNGRIDSEFLERNSQPTNKLVKRKLLMELGINKMFESCLDEAYIKVLCNAKNPVAVKEKLYFYRMGSGSMSTSYDNVEHYKKFIEASKCLKEEMRDVDDELKPYFDYRIIYYRLITMIVSANAGNREEFYKQKTALKEMSYQKNPYTFKVLINNFGILKGWIIAVVVNKNYYLTKFLCKLAF